ncbi:MAG: indole-3-glycerol phosphate synthase TrpC [Cyanobacteria bacterium]|nr:indole-3-glycerol phosphate synthase TrpC [Cyanobacteria bacterium CG_2015-16_32_12]NCO77700.1 indole-3-glycerol phosphate synthase TrpC [Cyanobacteria bacterium CG_2015-22_32_23]NCQ04325.1 indole-3-glycerol phosphate synthase TrpC [Cyanobacteria bacterium CG_2015-09_32_10]NCQ41319.1 indole-3-glycerol phosphate synthase TrpC [Cyanobacteria bacterium CG_2015-04_32_10]NCS83633.1 indole-3-glycerol phosphate synthase TrpC [Cyanobacteria bacterium CG_2015-02_32_10]
MKIRRQQPSPDVAVESLRYQVILPDSEPRNILEKIVWYKEKEVEKMRDRFSLLELRKQVLELSFSPLDFLSALVNSQKKPALIAEVKKASPSKGIIKENFDPVTIAKSYEKGGANCLSVLTDEKFFQGSFEYLKKVREAVKIPLLCKEFIIYPYQIYLARLNGADAVLLIAAILKDSDLRYFLKIIDNLKMTALIEVHTLEELDRVLSIDGVKLIGINNRNLENFEVSLDTTKNILAARQETILNRKITIVSESGLYTKNDLDFVSNAGANAVLIGESLIKQDDLELAINNLYSN